MRNICDMETIAELSGNMGYRNNSSFISSCAARSLSPEQLQSNTHFETALNFFGFC